VPLCQKLLSVEAKDFTSENAEVLAPGPGGLDDGPPPPAGHVKQKRETPPATPGRASRSSGPLKD